MDTYTNKDVDLSNEATRNQFIKNYQNITSKVDGKEPLSLSDVSKGNSIVLPDNKPTEVTTGVLGQNVESTLAGAKSQPKDDGKKEVETLMSNYLKGASETPEEVTSANEEAIARKTEAVKIQNELTAMDKAYRDEINEIRKNTEGAFGGAVQDRINKATDRYNDNRANVSIAYNTALGAYNSAVETAELKATTYKNRLDSMYKAWEMKKEAVYDLATPEEKAQLDLMTYEKKSQIDAKADAKSKVLQTMLKNGAPASAYSLVDEASNKPDATAESIYASAGRWGQEGTTTEAPKVVSVNGVDSIWDGTKFIPAPTSAVSSKTGEELTTVNDINNILQDPNFNTTFGISGIVFRNIQSTPQYALKQQVDNVINKLALAARGELKGQGAVSDFEGKMLKSAQTALSIGLSPDAARKEFAKIKGAIRTSSGLTATVKITDPKTKQSQIIDANSKGITEAINDGFNVEYQ